MSQKMQWAPSAKARRPAAPTPMESDSIYAYRVLALC